jgi:hypothetical protein
MSGAPHDFPSLKLGGHVCLPYTSESERHEAIGGFIRDGLLRGERCLYWGTPSEFEALATHLETRNVPVSSLRERGTLVFADALAAPGTSVDLDARAATIRAAIATARAQGYTSLRVVDDPDNRIKVRIDHEQLTRFESTLSTILGEKQATCLCTFDRRTTDPSLIEVALSTHDIAFVSGRPCPNPFFEAPGADASSDWGSERVARMAANILESAESRELLEAENAALIVETTRSSERDAVLARHVVALTRAVEARDRLIVAAARWLSRPLPAMCGHLGDLVQNEQFMHCREMLESCGEHLAAINRLSAGLDEIASFLQLQVVLRPEPLDIVAMARVAIEEIEDEPGPDGVRIVMEGAERIAGTWDRLRLVRLFHSLLSAAREQSQGANVHLRMDDLAQIVRIRLEFMLPHLPALSDSGEHQRSMAYGPSGESDYERLAVRLWPAREIVRMMGGTLGISTWADARVVFTLDLPKSTSASPAEVLPTAQ